MAPHYFNLNPGYKATSIVFSGINITLTTLNIINFNKPGKSKSNAGFTIISGLVQVALGAYLNNEGYAGLEVMNYAVGTATAITGGIRLFKKEKKHSEISIFPHAMPTKNGFVAGVFIALN